MEIVGIVKIWRRDYGIIVGILKIEIEDSQFRPTGHCNSKSKLLISVPELCNGDVARKPGEHCSCGNLATLRLAKLVGAERLPGDMSKIGVMMWW